MKGIKRLLILAMAFVPVFGMAACNQAGDGVLTVSFTISGYGSEYVDELVAAFEEETGIPVEVELDDNATNVNISRIVSTNRNEIDVFFAMVPSFANIDNYANQYGYDNLFQKLDDLYAMEVPDTGGQTLRDLVRDDLYEAQLTYDPNGGEGEIYTVPWTTSVEGFIYNQKVLDLYGIDSLPRTTNEFEEVLDIIKSGRTADGDIVAPALRAAGITCANNSAYWAFVWPTWWAQYEGLANYERYFSALPENATSNVPDWHALDQEGKKIAMEEVSRFIYKENGYMYEKCEDTSNLQSQVDFFDGKAAFIPSGSWIESETAIDYMNAGVELDYGVMPTPVTSSLGTKLGISEEELRAAIDYIDGTTDTVPTYAGKDSETASQITERIREARGLVHSGLTDQNKVYIASYSSELEEAYQFVLFYASPKAQQILMKYGILSAFGYSAQDIEVTSDFVKSMDSLLQDENSQLVFTVDKYPICYKAGLTDTAHRTITSATRTFEKILYDGTKSVNDLYEEELLYYQTNWSRMLTAAGYGRS